jgi:hypothetical protein
MRNSNNSSVELDNSLEDEQAILILNTFLI